MFLKSLLNRQVCKKVSQLTQEEVRSPTQSKSMAEIKPLKELALKRLKSTKGKGMGKIEQKVSVKITHRQVLRFNNSPDR